VRVAERRKPPISIRAELLGGFALYANRAGKRIHLPTRQAKALFSYLALEGGRPISRSRLADLLWTDKEHRSAARSLRQAIFAVRKALGEAGRACLQSGRDEVRLVLQSVDVDALRFRTLAAADSVGDLEAAAALYRGELLSELIPCGEAFEEWLQVQRTHFQDLAIGALRTLADRSVAQGDWRSATRFSTRLLELDPYDDAAHGALMRALGMQGRINEAIRHYRRYVEILARELSAGPGQDTKDVYRSLLSKRPPSASQAARQRSANIAPPCLAVWLSDEVQAEGGARSNGHAVSDPAAVTRLQRPTVMVEPFTGARERSSLACLRKSLSQSFVMALSRCNFLRVTVRDGGPTAAMSDEAVRYRVSGSLNVRGAAVRFSVRLSEAARHDTVWQCTDECKLSEFDRALMQVAGDVAKAVLDHVDALSSDLALPLQPVSVDGRRCYAEALRLLARFDRTSLRRAQRLLDHLVRLEPDFPPAATCRAYLHMARGWWEKYELPHHERALRVALAALGRGRESSYSHAVVGSAYLGLGDFDNAEFYLLRSRALQSEHPDTFAIQAMLSIFLGRHEDALNLASQGIALSFEPDDLLIAQLCAALFGLGRFEEAVAGARCMRTMPFWSHAWLASAYGYLGDRERAGAHLSAYRRAAPGRSVYDAANCEPYRDGANNERLLRGLIEAESIGR